MPTPNSAEDFFKRARERDSEIETDIVNDDELALQALDYILLTVPSPQTKQFWDQTLGTGREQDASGRPVFTNDAIPFAFCMQDEAHKQGKENSYAMKMIAKCNDPKTGYLKAVDTYTQPYIWFYSGTL
jgi:hypothetical protein